MINNPPTKIIPRYPLTIGPRSFADWQNGQHDDVKQRRRQQDQEESKRAEKFAQHHIRLVHRRGHQRFDRAASPIPAPSGPSTEADDRDQQPDHPIKQIPHPRGLARLEIVPEEKAAGQQEEQPSPHTRWANRSKLDSSRRAIAVARVMDASPSMARPWPDWPLPRTKNSSSVACSRRISRSGQPALHERPSHFLAHIVAILHRPKRRG